MLVCWLFVLVRYVNIQWHRLDKPKHMHTTNNAQCANSSPILYNTNVYISTFAGLLSFSDQLHLASSRFKACHRAHTNYHIEILVNGVAYSTWSLGFRLDNSIGTKSVLMAVAWNGPKVVWPCLGSYNNTCSYIADAKAWHTSRNKYLFTDSSWAGIFGHWASCCCSLTRLTLSSLSFSSFWVS